MADRSRDPTIGCFAPSNLSGRPPRQASTTKRNLWRLPWAHRTRLQQLLLLLLTANVSNQSGNLLFAQSYPEQYEKVGFVHSWCTVEFHQKSHRVNPALRQYFHEARPLLCAVGLRR